MASGCVDAADKPSLVTAPDISRCEVPDKVGALRLPGIYIYITCFNCHRHISEHYRFTYWLYER